jgi:membrane-associated phospholipid phosphatase
LILFSFTLGAPADSEKINKYWLFILGAVVFYEFCYQIIVQLEHTKIFLRSSPSFHLNGIDLSIFDPHNIKIYATSSFPSGHAMVLGYWCASTSFIFPEHMQRTCRVISFVLCLPRLVGGGHWLSDVITGYILGNLFFEAYLFLLKKIAIIKENQNQSYAQNKFC